MSNIKEVISLSKNYKLLYAEDDISIQSEMKQIFEMFFKDVVVANDGIEALEILDKDKNIDIIISDIQMPNMDGLEMASKIRSFNKDIPIILITAFNDEEYFIKSIEIKIDKYILKPIKDEQIASVIGEVCRSLYQKNEYVRLKALERQREVAQKQQEVISKITDAFVSPTIIFQNSKAIYYSKPFMDLFKYKKIDFETLKEEDNIFEDKKTYMKNLKSYDEKNPLNNHSIINQKVGKKIFKVIKKDILINENNQQMYMLVDITKEEYQKVKIESYVKSLEIMAINKKKQEILPPQKKDNALEISNEQTLKLRKRHKHIMTSQELVESIDDFIITELQELDDLDRDLKEAMFGIDSGDFSSLELICELLNKYAEQIYVVEEFEDLYSSVKSLANILSLADINLIETSKHSEFAIYLQSVREDLALWRKSIFIDQNTENIHYLDSSLFSTALHIEMLINGSEDVDTQEDDLEFF